MIHGGMSSMLNKQEDPFQLLIDSIEDYAIYMLDRTGHVVTWNRGAELNKGFTRREVLGKHFRIFFVPEDIAAGVPDEELSVAASTGRCAGEGWRLHKSGTRFWAGFVLTAMRNAAGELVGFAKITRDLSDQKRSEGALLAVSAALREERDRLQEERDRFHAAAESSLDAFYICQSVRDESGEIEDFVFTYLNSNVEQMISIPRSGLLGRRMCEVLPVNCENGMLQRYKDVVETGEPLVHEFPVQDRDVKSSWIRVQAVKLRDGVAITASDITRRKRDEDRILHMAQHDDLTGLPNRSVMADRAGQAIKRAKRYGHRMAVLMIDLDGFKRVNDALGHHAGDAVLIEIANRLQASIRDQDTVIRVGGDEFVVVIPELFYERDLDTFAQKLLVNLRPPIKVKGQSVGVTCSIGIAIYPDHASTFESLLSKADTGMYAAKSRGKNQIDFVKVADGGEIESPASPL